MCNEVCTWTVHLAHTEASIAGVLVFPHNVQSNWSSIAHIHFQGAGSGVQGLKGTQSHLMLWEILFLEHFLSPWEHCCLLNRMGRPVFKEIHIAILLRSWNPFKLTLTHFIRKDSKWNPEPLYALLNVYIRCTFHITHCLNSEEDVVHIWKVDEKRPTAERDQEDKETHMLIVDWCLPVSFSTRIYWSSSWYNADAAFTAMNHWVLNLITV